MDDTLRTCHPAVSFAYFALVIACAMLLMHPVCLVLSLSLIHISEPTRPY